MPKTDVLIAHHSDMHSGGATALCPDMLWHFDNERNHTPNSKQQKIIKTWKKVLAYIAQARKGKTLITVHNGDAIDGFHHGTTQVTSRNTGEQADMHIYLMNEYLKKAGHDRRKGDRLYYTKGTEVHTGDAENKIAEELNAETGAAFDVLELEINGRLVWFYHHGANAGKGANSGNALRNSLRDIFWDCVKDDRRPPDLVFTGHVHTPDYNSYIGKYKKGWHTVYGVISPSWQAKTRYAYKVAAIAQNAIGSVFVEIKADGTIVMPPDFVAETTRF